MGLYRPYESKRRVRDLLKLPAGYLSGEEISELEKLWVHLQIRYPWSKEKP